MKNRFTVPLSLVLLSFVFVFSFSFAKTTTYTKTVVSKVKTGALLSGDHKRPEFSGMMLSGNGLSGTFRGW